MTNHPSRGWRRRAETAAAAWLARWRADEPGSARLLTRAQLDELMRASYLAGYDAGRIDSPRPRHAAP